VVVLSVHQLISVETSILLYFRGWNCSSVHGAEMHDTVFHNARSKSALCCKVNISHDLKFVRRSLIGWLWDQWEWRNLRRMQRRGKKIQSRLSEVAPILWHMLKIYYFHCFTYCRLLCQVTRRSAWSEVKSPIAPWTDTTVTVRVTVSDSVSDQLVTQFVQSLWSSAGGRAVEE
jgi:hypothetical protein